VIVHFCRKYNSVSVLSMPLQDGSWSIFQRVQSSTYLLVNIFVGNTEDAESEYGPSNDDIDDDNGKMLFIHLIWD
jgi:hypothetical protein